MKMRKVYWIGSLMVLVSGILFGGIAIAANEHMDHGSASGQNAQWKPAKMSGEFVDLGCYVAHDATGKNHLSCALECANAGAPLAFLEKGTKRLFIIVTTGHGQNPYTEPIKYLAEPVEVEGATTVKNGVKALMITDIKKTVAKPKGGGKAGVKETQVSKEVYICPMNEYTSDKPGNCPKCGMKLVLKQ